MQKRPIGVAVVSWIVIIYWSINLLLALLIAVNADKLTMIQQHLRIDFSPAMACSILTMFFINPAINITMGILMLNGINWARYVFLVFNIIILVFALFTLAQKLMMIINVVVFLIFLYYIFNKSANAFFTKN